MSTVVNTFGSRDGGDRISDESQADVLDDVDLIDVSDEVITISFLILTSHLLPLFLFSEKKYITFHYIFFLKSIEVTADT